MAAQIGPGDVVKVDGEAFPLHYVRTAIQAYENMLMGPPVREVEPCGRTRPHPAHVWDVPHPDDDGSVMGYVCDGIKPKPHKAHPNCMIEGGGQ